MATITITRNVHSGKFWAALVTGTDAKFGFAREFTGTKRDVTAARTNTYRDIELTLHNIEDGQIYEFGAQDSSRANTRWFARIESGELVTISADEVRQAVAA